MTLFLQKIGSSRPYSLEGKRDLEPKFNQILYRLLVEVVVSEVMVRF